MNTTSVPAEHLEVLRTEISKHLTELSILDGYIQPLKVSRQRSLLGFMSPEARQVLEQLTHEELLARRDHIHDGQGDDVGLKFMNADWAVRGTASQAPANISPAAFDAIAWATLQHQVHQATRHLTAADEHLERTRGWCPWPKVVRDLPLVDHNGTPTDPGMGALAARLRILTWDIRYTRLLEDISRELAHLRTLAELIVDGSDRTSLPDPCPHCGRHTLVVLWRTDTDNNGVRIPDVARCEKDPKTGHHEPCTCESAWCECKTTPVTYRHTWWHSPRDAPDPRTAHDWHDLASRLNIQRATKEPTP